MIPSIKAPGGNTRGLLAYLYGPGRHNEHLDPHIVASFSLSACAILDATRRRPSPSSPGSSMSR